MEASEELKNFIKDNKDLVLDIEQDPDKANKLMSKLEDATGSFRAHGIQYCNINTLTFNSNVQLYKNAIYECYIKSWNILNDLTIKSPFQTFRNYIREYKDCEFIVKNSTELVFEDINYSVDLVTYLEEDVEATNIKIV